MSIRAISLVLVVAIATMILVVLGLKPAYPSVELQLVSVDVLRERQLPQSDKDWPSGTFSSPLIRVTFASRSDLADLATRWHYTVSNTTTTCPESGAGHSREIEGFPYVFDQYRWINEYERPRSSRGTSTADSILYHIYFEPAQIGIFPYSYDLISDPRDICFFVHGASWYARITSNTVVIPKRVLVDALSRAHLNCGTIVHRCVEAP
jgi:hypothetical protein